MNPVVTVVLASIRDIHRALAWVAVLGNAVAGLWALGAHSSTALRGRALWWWTAAAQLAIVAQAFVGVGLVTAEGLDPPEFHLLYGSAAVVSVGIVYGYRHQVEARRHLVYGLAGLFLMGLGIRAMVIGPG